MTLPISLDQAKAQLRVDGDDQDDEIEDLIRDAAAWVEDYTGLILEARDVTEHFRAPGRSIQLRAWPVATSAIVTAQYPATASDDALNADVRLVADTRPARVLPAAGATWPSRDPWRTLAVTVRAGFEDANEVPRALCRAMLLMISAFDADREGGEIFANAEAAAKNLCRRYKRYSL